MNEEILEQLIERAATVFNISADELSENTSFKDDLKAKSVNIVQIITFLEDELDIEIPFMEFRRKATFAEAVEFLETLIDE